MSGGALAPCTACRSPSRTMSRSPACRCATVGRARATSCRCVMRSWLRASPGRRHLHREDQPAGVAHKVLTDSPKFGVTRSPWSLDRTPGGSSGGGRGTRRRHRPDRDRHRRRRFESLPGRVHRHVRTQGDAGAHPVRGHAGSVRELRLRRADDPHGRGIPLLLSVMSGACAGRPIFARDVSLFPRRAAECDPRVLRVAWIERFGAVAPEPAVADLTGRAVKMLEGQGARIETPAVPEFETCSTHTSSSRPRRMLRGSIDRAEVGRQAHAIDPREHCARPDRSAAEWQRQ